LEHSVLEVFETSTHRRVASAWLTGQKKVELMLPHGRYLIALGEGNDRSVAEADLVWKQELRLTSGQFRPNRKGVFAAKGLSPARPFAWRIEGGSFRPFGREFGLVARSGFRWQSGAWEPEMSFGFGRSSVASAGGLSVTDSHWIFAAGIDRTVTAFRFGRATLGFRSNFHRIIQTVRDDRFEGDSISTETGALPSSSTLRANVYGLSLPLTLEIYMTPGASFTLTAAPSTVWFHDASRGGWKSSFWPETATGIEFPF
jgi:hypothetical protein